MTGAARRVRERFSLLVVCLVVTAVTFLQRPGEIVPDSKSDLAYAPVRFLGRALHLWEPLGQFGQLQNQAYGYLVPMGPFFLLGHLVQAPAWAVQRTWLAVVLCTALTGTALLARRLGVRSFLACLLAGLAYAFAPRMIGLAGSISIEALPTALAPWVLVPLVTAGRSRSPRRAAALSGLAVLLMGGVNAAATLAALAPAVVWLALRLRSAPGRRLAAWWSLAAACACAWWAVPLVILGRYSPPFIDWVEYADVTTRTTSLVEVLRGTDHWLGKLATSSGAVWPSSYALSVRHSLVAATVVVAALGLAGLAHRSMPYRRSLTLMLMTGVFLVGVAYVGAATGPLASAARDSLDGPLAPFRNVHKFDSCVRLPLVLGLGHLVDRVRGRLRVPVGGSRTWSLPRRSAVAGLAVAALGLTVLMPARGDLYASAGVQDVPDYWRQAAAYLEQQPGRTLVYPGMSTPTFVWGQTRDDPLSFLGDVSYATRDQVPLSSAGNIRWLDAVQSRLDSGLGSPGLAASLARAGVARILVRNDADWVRAGAPRPALVHQALTRSPGLHRVATFGPVVWALPSSADVIVDRGLEGGYPAVEVYAVDDPAPPVRSVALTDVTRVGGGPESELALDDAGLLPGRPRDSATLVDGDPDTATVHAERDVLTDGMRRREVDVGVTRNNGSPTMSRSDPLRLGRPVRDYLPYDTTGHETVATYTGVADVRASSSASDPGAFRRRDIASIPFAALDGDASTAWTSSSGRALGQWWEVRFRGRRAVSTFSVQLAAPATGAAVTRLDVWTQGGHREVPVGPGVQQVQPAPGPTRWLRLTAAATADGGPGTTFGLREVAGPGVTADRALRMPPGAGALTPHGAPAVVATGDVGNPASCVDVGGTHHVCEPGMATTGEDTRRISRVFSLPQGATFALHARALPLAGAARLLAPGRPLLRAAGAAESGDAASSAQAAVDSDLGTAWLADGGVGATLQVRWGERRQISGLVLGQAPGLAASVPTRLLVQLGGRTYDVSPTGQVVRFPATAARRLRIEVTGVAARRDVRLGDGTRRDLPVGISELTVLGAEDLKAGNRSADTFTQPCGFGPSVVVDGVPVPTSVSGTIGDVVAGRALPVRACGRPLTLAAGVHRLTATPSAEFLVDALSLVPDDWRAGAGSPQRRVDTDSWGSTRRVVTVGAGGASLLVVAENFNDGWTAALAGRPLHAVRVDGWMQAFEVPAGSGGEVVLTFGPDRTYRLSLLALPVGLLLLVLFAAAPSRRAWRPEPVPEIRSRRAALVVSLLALVVLGGWWGLGAVVVGLLLQQGAAAAYPRRRYPVGLLVAAPFLVAGLLVTVRPWGQVARPQLLGFWPQLCCLVALSTLAWVVATTGDGRQRDGTRSRHRDTGRSTSAWAAPATARLAPTATGSTSHSHPENSSRPVQP